MEYPDSLQRPVWAGREQAGARACTSGAAVRGVPRQLATPCVGWQGAGRCKSVHLWSGRPWSTQTACNALCGLAGSRLVQERAPSGAAVRGVPRQFTYDLPENGLPVRCSRSTWDTGTRMQERCVGVVLCSCAGNALCGLAAASSGVSSPYCPLLSHSLALDSPLHATPGAAPMPTARSRTTARERAARALQPLHLGHRDTHARALCCVVLCSCAGGPGGFEHHLLVFHHPIALC